MGNCLETNIAIVVTAGWDEHAVQTSSWATSLVIVGSFSTWLFPLTVTVAAHLPHCRYVPYKPIVSISCQHTDKQTFWCTPLMVVSTAYICYKNAISTTMFWSKSSQLMVRFDLGRHPSSLASLICGVFWGWGEGASSSTF